MGLMRRREMVDKPLIKHSLITNIYNRGGSASLITITGTDSFLVNGNNTSWKAYVTNSCETTYKISDLVGKYVVFKCKISDSTALSKFDVSFGITQSADVTNSGQRQTFSGNIASSVSEDGVVFVRKKFEDYNIAYSSYLNSYLKLYIFLNGSVTNVTFTDVELYFEE